MIAAAACIPVPDGDVRRSMQVFSVKKQCGVDTKYDRG